MTVISVNRYFLENGHAEEINRDSPIGCKGELAEEFADLMKQMWSGDNRSYSPSSLKDVVGKYVRFVLSSFQALFRHC